VQFVGWPSHQKGDICLGLGAGGWQDSPVGIRRHGAHRLGAACFEVILCTAAETQVFGGSARDPSTQAASGG
jgi:hypothetical protein